jgi:hypothetical protein
MKTSKNLFFCSEKRPKTKGFVVSLGRNKFKLHFDFCPIGATTLLIWGTATSIRHDNNQKFAYEILLFFSRCL